MILLKKVLWYMEDEGYTVAYNLTDIISFDTGNGLEIQNNVLTLNLKNPMVKYKDFGGDIGFQPIGKHAIDDSSTIGIRFKERDQIKLYLKYSDDATDSVSNEWSDSSDTAPDNEYLIGVYYVTDIKISSGEKSSPIKLVCADKTYILFNKILAKTFIKDEGLTTPELVQKIIQLSAQSSNANKSAYTGINNVLYDIKAELNTTYPYDGTGIQAKRSDDTDFPVKAMTKVWKPIYEWIGDLSQVDYLNTETELSENTIVYGNPFIFYVDENNEFHWFEQNKDIDGTIIAGVDNIISHSFTYGVFDVKNMLIFNCGEDMNGHGILDYQLDLTSNVKGLKMQYLPFVKISKDYIANDYQKFTINTNRKTDKGTYPEYPLDTEYTGGLETAWSNEGLRDAEGDIEDSTSDGTYNSTLRRASKVKGKERARSILSGLASARWKGDMEVYGAKYQAGNLIEFTDTRFGLVNEKLRIQDVKHSISKSGWFTKLSLEADEAAITAE